MADDRSSAKLPHEFVIADRELRRVLKDEISRVCPKVVKGKRVPASIRYATHVTFSDDVGKSVRRYVRALRLIRGARSELLRRAMLFNSMTAQEAEFANALAAVRKVFEPFDTVQADHPRADWVPVAAELARFEPLSVAHVEQLILHSEGLLVYSPGKTPLVRLKEAAQEVVDAAHDACSEGCHALLLYGIKLSGSGHDAEFMTFLESIDDPEAERNACQSPSTLNNMVQAAKSMEDWVVRVGSRDPHNNGMGTASTNSPPKRTRRTKAETERAVLAPIALKLQNPGWEESRCATEAGLPVSTLNGHRLWIEWLPKIEAANTDSKRTKVKQAFDRRVGDTISIDPNSERDPHTGKRFT